jgi:hypothetical protein
METGQPDHVGGGDAEGDDLEIGRRRKKGREGRHHQRLVLDNRDRNIAHQTHPKEPSLKLPPVENDGSKAFTRKEKSPSPKENTNSWNPSLDIPEVWQDARAAVLGRKASETPPNVAGSRLPTLPFAERLT